MNDYIIEKLLILSCNIDDFNPQNYEYISQKLFEHNALDVWLTPISLSFTHLTLPTNSQG